MNSIMRIADAKRSPRAEAAVEIADKGYCSSKDMYYHGVRLHVTALKREQHINEAEQELPAQNHQIHLFTPVKKKKNQEQLFLLLSIKIDKLKYTYFVYILVYHIIIY